MSVIHSCRQRRYHTVGLLLAALFLFPIAARAQSTFLYVVAEEGGWIPGSTVPRLFTPADGTFVASLNSRNGVDVGLTGPNQLRWLLQFAATDDAPLAAGAYEAARRTAFSTPFNGLDVSGSGVGCNPLTGRFVVREIVMNGSTVERFAADFEQHCSELVPGLFGSIRINSTVSAVVPFNGQFPVYSLTISPPSNGRITGEGIDCGLNGSTCHRAAAAAARVSLTATAAPGYVFAGWTGECHGGTIASIHVNGPKQCGAAFLPVASASPRTLFVWQSSAGDAIGLGKTEVFSAANSRWVLMPNNSGRGLALKVRFVGDVRVVEANLQFMAPAGQVLTPGVHYTGAILWTDAYASTTTPGMNVSMEVRSCGPLVGDFTVRELVYGSGGEVQSLALDFEQRCVDASRPPLTGTIRYNSLVEQSTMMLDKMALHFGATTNGAAFIVQTPPQRVRLTQSGAGPVTWTASSSQPWITISPASGTGSATLEIGVVHSSVLPAPAATVGAVTIQLGGAGYGDVSLQVSIILSPHGASFPPLGVVDTPLDGAVGVTGAIPITGWAIDDVGVTNVAVCRAAVAGEAAPLDARCSGLPQIFVGNAVFVEGSRPDVETYYPLVPFANRGWGFMLLTNMLPAGGNGTYTFYAYATDYDGHTQLLGQRTMTCSNAAAVRPFGAIDTPEQGGVAAGSAFINFGWVLTPQPKTIPTDGSTITVLVDGIAVGNASYNHFRPDIAALFPGFNNSNGAVGYRILDTTSLANGLHTISWVVTDDQGSTEGIGSRYFTVSNGANVMASGVRGVPALAPAAIDQAATAPANVIDAPRERRAIVGRRGWDLGAPWTSYPVDVDGVAVVRGEELDRFELVLAEPVQTPVRYAGYLRAGERLAPLPIGSQLDATRGTFTWAPGVGFVGSYDLVFIGSIGDRAIARQQVRFVLHPKGRGLVGVQVAIDAPTARQDVAQPFMLGGWAADLDATDGTGVSGLHAWAYPLTGGPPIFLGALTYGGARPDVAAVHNAQFRDSGFGTIVQGLAHGTYDLAVFAWSTAKGDFMPGRTVRVTVR